MGCYAPLKDLRPCSVHPDKLEGCPSRKESIEHIAIKWCLETKQWLVDDNPAPVVKPHYELIDPNWHKQLKCVANQLEHFLQSSHFQCQVLKYCCWSFSSLASSPFRLVPPFTLPPPVPLFLPSCAEFVASFPPFLMLQANCEM